MELDELLAIYAQDGELLDNPPPHAPPNPLSCVDSNDASATVRHQTASSLAQQQDNEDDANHQVAATPQKKPMKNPARERLKRELGFLRECVSDLENELTTLRTQKRPHAAVAAGDAWQTIIESERIKRSRSELENECLRRTLETQLQVATELTTYLRARASAASSSSSSSSGDCSHDDDSVTHIPPPLFSSFTWTTAQFLQDIERAYAARDAIFTGPAWETLPDERVFVSTVKTRKCKAGFEQMYIELMDTAYRSHDYQRSCDAVWQATRQVYADDSRVIDRGVISDDVIAARYRGSGLTRRGMSKDLVVTGVTKKFVEKDRTVIVWRTCYSPAQHESDMPMQALSDETGWMILTRVPEGIPNRAPGTAFFQACNRLVPVWFDGDVADSSVRTQLAIGEFTNVVLSATEADVSGFENAFQRLVLSDDCSDDAETTSGVVAIASDPKQEIRSLKQEELVAFV